MKISGYKIEKQIGLGGMARVYLATQQSLGRPVALKVMNPFYSDTAEFTERFLEEGRLLASIQHLNIITIHDIGISDGLYFISMEYVEGGDLQQRIKKGINTPDASQYLEILATCLDVAHEIHIVHRDIKPANILFRKDGSLLLTDFGIAKQLTVSKELTMVGGMIGSPNYISPEQAQGLAVDGRADIYSLGIVFYEMLTGKRPFSGDSAFDIANCHINQPLPALPENLATYQKLLDRMTRKKPEDRFPSCKSLLAALREIKTTGQWDGQVMAIPLPDLPVNIPTSNTQVFSSSNHALGETIIEFNATDTATLVDKTRLNSNMNHSSPFYEFLTHARIKAIDALNNLQLNIKYPASWGAGILSILVILLIISSQLIDGQGAAIQAFNNNDSEKINTLIKNAQLALDEYRLTTPAEQSAHTYYQQILQLDPDNQAAQQGMHKIAESYFDLASKSLTNWNFDKANQYVKQGLIIEPENEHLLKLQITLQEKSDSPEHSFKNTFKDVKAWFK